MRAKTWLIGVGSIAAAVALTFAAVATWTSGRHQSAPQARHYLNATACLLTDPRGIAPGTPGAPAWKAMEAASLATHVMVSYLPDTGPADAATMLNTLTERQCGVIVATGSPAAAVIKAAHASPHQHFVLVAASAALIPGTPETIVVSPSNAPERIDQAIRALARQARNASS
jgi:basic membrane lipoprotein Med (substrate-binding protein (PBP1-ABC) superfamily)